MPPRLSAHIPLLQPVFTPDVLTAACSTASCHFTEQSGLACIIVFFHPSDWRVSPSVLGFSACRRAVTSPCCCGCLITKAAQRRAVQRASDQHSSELNFRLCRTGKSKVIDKHAGTLVCSGLLRLAGQCILRYPLPSASGQLAGCCKLLCGAATAGC